VASADVRQEEKIKTAGLETSVPIRGYAMERHHLPTHCVAGICDLVASADVRQEEKIKTAGLDSSVPIIQFPIRLNYFPEKLYAGTHGFLPQGKITDFPESQNHTTT
jgi:hypothetical protein